jgi:hypothetical protein
MDSHRRQRSVWGKVHIETSTLAGPSGSTANKGETGPPAGLSKCSMRTPATSNRWTQESEYQRRRLT